MSTLQSFSELSLPASLAQALATMQFTQPTPVQSAAIPPALAGQDILATAQTGTGKTAAFGIPLVTALAKNAGMDALILAPTRELAAQIHEVLRTLSRGQNMFGVLVVGGESFNRQASDLRRGADYIVATPGRLNDHLERGTVNLSRVGFLVFDEVDRMLDMGFLPQIKRITRQLPQNRQTLLFSATLPKEIENLANAFLVNPVRITIGKTSTPAPQVDEQMLTTTNEGKNTLILSELDTREGRVIVFARTKHRADRLASMLAQKGHGVVSLHGGRSQGQRKQALDRFRAGTHRILVATDLAGRGIDVADIRHVINYDVPATREDYIHRIGRTGRSGKTGAALNFLVSGDYEGERIFLGSAARAKASLSRPSRRYGSRRPR